MGQDVPPISVTCCKWYIRKAPIFLRAQPLDSRVAAGLLNKLASRKLWCPISLSERSHNIPWGSSGIWGSVFSPPCPWLRSPAHQEGRPCQVQWEVLIWEERALSQ
jgi:hypothetical protein